MLNAVSRLWRDEEGQGLIEYVFILALIAVVVVVALSPIGTITEENIKSVGDELNK